MLARSALITQWSSNQVPWDPWLCILLAHGSMVVHTSGPWIHGCAYFRPMDPRLCIMLAHGSKVVHHAGPWIQGCASSPGPQLQPVPAPMESIEGTASSPGPWIHGCASCWPPWDPSRELHRVPARSSNQYRPPWNRLRELHRVPSRGIHRGNCIESPPVGIASCWPGRR